MSLRVHIDGKAKIFRLFDLRQLLGETEIDPMAIDVADSDEVEKLYETVSEFVETGEVGAYDDMLFHMHGIDPEICEITLQNGQDHVVTLDEVTLKNQPMEKLSKTLHRFEEGEMFLVTMTTGDATWDFESDIETDRSDPAKLTMPYYDCSEEMDQEALRSTALYELLCDTVSTDGIHYGRKPLELSDFVLHPKRVYGQIFIVRRLLGSDVKVLERIDPPNADLQDQSWQLMQNLSDTF